MKKLIITIFILGIFSIAGATVYNAVRDTARESVLNAVNPLDISTGAIYWTTPYGSLWTIAYGAKWTETYDTEIP